MGGTLYICPTPIGNLKDITERVVDTLRTVHLIAAEDTRHSRKLLSHLCISARVVSCHEHNEEKASSLIRRALVSGQDVALITDAGTPTVSDPGYRLVAGVVADGLSVVALPGPSALLTALSLSGFEADRFVFEGFLPSKPADRRARIGRMEGETRTVILYESPHRLLQALSELSEALGKMRKAVICRELTKIHEEIIRGTLEELIGRVESQGTRGEYVLVLQGDAVERRTDLDPDKEAMLKAYIRELIRDGASRKSAARQAAKAAGVRQREAYSVAVEIE